MGYYVYTTECAWSIPAKNIRAALSAVTGGEQTNQTLEQFVADVGFECETWDGNFHIYGYGDKSRDEEELIRAIAPYSQEGSYMDFLGEQDERYRFKVVDGKLKTYYGVTKWIGDS